MYNLSEFIDTWQNEKNYSWESFWLMFGSFLDLYYLKKDPAMFAKKPSYNDNVPIQIRAFIDAATDYLLRDSTPPAWVKNPDNTLEEPFFPSSLKGAIRAIMLIESPVEFKVRNIYVTHDVLTRA